MEREQNSITLAPGTATAMSLDGGDEVKITSPQGGQGGDFTFVGFDQALSRNINGWEEFGTVQPPSVGTSTQTAEPPRTPAPPEVALEARLAPSPTTAPVPRPTLVVSTAGEGCVSGTAEITEGQNPARYTTSGPGSGCCDGVGGSLDETALTWAELGLGTVVTFVNEGK